MPQKARINPEVLKWARKRAALSHEELAKKVAVSNPKKIATWEAAQEHPSFNQAHALANVLRIPFGYLFLSRLPDATTTVPDLRTKGGSARPMSVDLVEVYEDALRKQLWLAQFRKEQGDQELAFVGSAQQGRSSPADVARSIGRTLALDDNARAQFANWETFSTRLVDAAENVGVTVMRSSSVLGNHHRKLQVDEFRGFAIADHYAPVVFVNTADAKPAQLFTLVHELAHLWLAQTGVSRPELADKRTDDDGDAEGFCDRVAAEFLVPEKMFLASWDSGASLDDNATTLSRRFKVSTIVIARRAYELGRIKYADYAEYLSEQIAMARARAKEKATDGQGPPPAVMIPTRNGKRLTELLVSRAHSGEMLWRDAGQLLGCSPAVLHSLVPKPQRGD